MKKEKKEIAPVGVIAVALVDKLKQRICDIEKMKMGELTRPLVKEWRRLKSLEKEVFGR